MFGLGSAPFVSWVTLDQGKAMSDHSLASSDARAPAAAQQGAGQDAATAQAAQDTARGHTQPNEEFTPVFQQ